MKSLPEFLNAKQAPKVSQFPTNKTSLELENLKSIIPGWGVTMEARPIISEVEKWGFFTLVLSSK